MWLVGGTNNSVCGFSLVDGKKATDKNNPTFTRASKWIDEGRKYVTTVKVRNNFVEAYLDDKLICHFDTDYSNMGLLNLYTLHENNALGLDSEGSALTVESAEVIEITGQGTLLKPDQSLQPAVSNHVAEKPSVSAPSEAAPIVQFSTKSLAEIFGNNQLRPCHVDTDGTMTSEKEEVTLTLIGTEHKDFSVSGEIFYSTDITDAATAKSKITGVGGVLFGIRSVDRLHGYGAGMGLNAKRVLIEGKMVQRMFGLPAFDVPTHQWLPCGVRSSNKGNIRQGG